MPVAGYRFPGEFFSSPTCGSKFFPLFFLTRQGFPHLIRSLLCRQQVSLADSCLVRNTNGQKADYKCCHRQRRSEVICSVFCFPFEKNQITLKNFLCGKGRKATISTRVCPALLLDTVKSAPVHMPSTSCTELRNCFVKQNSINPWTAWQFVETNSSFSVFYLFLFYFVLFSCRSA